MYIAEADVAYLVVDFWLLGAKIRNGDEGRDGDGFIESNLRREDEDGSVKQCVRW